MPASIGLRVYSFSVRRKRDRKTPIALGDAALKLSTPKFITQFVTMHSEGAVQHDELERSWYFEPDENEAGNSRGYVRYGTYGFESHLVDGKTKKRNYKRKTSDVEEIPLYYEIWCSALAFGLIAFQSFQGRSCIHIVMSRLQKHFEQVNPGFLISFKKLLPNDVKGSLYYGSPVKKLTLIKRNASSDITDQYFSGELPGAVDFEVSLSAKRRHDLGDLGSLFKSLNRSAAGIVTHDGIEFGEAVAQVRIGGRLHRVGIFGSDSEAGVIDLTDMLEKGADGHPTYASLAQQTGLILKDFYKVLAG